MRLVLASTSPYRRDLLDRLGVPFETLAPDVEESHQPGETPAATVARLAEAKARAGHERAPGALVIGSDQLASLDGEALGKPGDADAAARQLAAMTGREIVYCTAVTVCDADGACRSRLDLSRVRLRAAGHAEIARYLDAEQPFDCAGALKLERLGIALCERIDTHDPTALIGLPLIATTELLRAAGLAIP